jgi:tRNA-2-methylthio-N6-dimethylallyladenosine synthase
VLVEGASRTEESRLRGRTRHNKTVHFPAHPAAPPAPGELVEVEVTGATSTTLAGEAPALATIH